MDNNKLDYGNSLKKQIEKEIGRLSNLDEALKRSKKDPEFARISVYNTAARVDPEVFEIAYTLQEKRVRDRLEKLEKEFADL